MAIMLRIEALDSMVVTEVIDCNDAIPRRRIFRLVINDTDGNGVDVRLTRVDVALLQALIKEVV